MKGKEARKGSKGEEEREGRVGGRERDGKGKTLFKYSLSTPPEQFHPNCAYPMTANDISVFIKGCLSHFSVSQK